MQAQRILPEVMVGFAIALPTLHFTFGVTYFARHHDHYS